MGSEGDEATSDGCPTVKALIDHVTTNFTSVGVYARGSGEDFVQIVLPNRMSGFPAFLQELSQCAGKGSQIVYVATSEETRLDVYLGSRFENGSPIPGQKQSVYGPLFAGVLLGLLVALLAAYMVAAPAVGAAPQ